MIKEDFEENYEQFNNEFDEPIKSFGDSEKNSDGPIQNDIDKKSTIRFTNILLLMFYILFLVFVIGLCILFAIEYTHDLSTVIAIILFFVMIIALYIIACFISIKNN